MNEGHNEMLQIAFIICSPFGSLVAVPHDTADQETLCSRWNTSQAHFRAHLQSMGEMWSKERVSVEINAWLHFILHENGLLKNNPIYGIINILTQNPFVLEPLSVCGGQMLSFPIWNYYCFCIFLGGGVQRSAHVDLQTHAYAHHVGQTMAIVSAFQ